MITNQRQYKISKKQAEKFAGAIRDAERSAASTGVHPRVHAAMIDGLRSQLEELESDLTAYDALVSGSIRNRTITSLADFPVVVIEGRIAKHMTQKSLGEKVGLPEQQIQRYEANRYAGVGLERLQEIADAIGLRLRKTISFDIPEMVLVTTGGSGRVASRSTAKRATAKRATAKRATAKRATAKRATAKRATAKRATAKRSTAKRSTAKRATAKRSTAKRSTAKRSTAKRATGKRSTAKRSA